MSFLPYISARAGETDSTPGAGDTRAASGAEMMASSLFSDS